MKAKVLKTFRDKETGSILRPGIIISITEERVEELTSVLAPFVEVIEVKGNILTGLDLSNERDMTVINGEVIEPKENDGEIDSIAFTKMKKEEIVKYAKEVMDIELNMEMTKVEMIELLKK